jgi:hypothetical protein
MPRFHRVGIWRRGARKATFTGSGLLLLIGFTPVISSCLMLSSISCAISPVSWTGERRREKEHTADSCYSLFSSSQECGTPWITTGGKFNIGASEVSFRIGIRFARCRSPMNGLAGGGIFLVDRGRGVLMGLISVWCLVCLTLWIDATSWVRFMLEPVKRGWLCTTAYEKYHLNLMDIEVVTAELMVSWSIYKRTLITETMGLEGR